MKVAVAGLGLIGGSLYKAALAAGHEAVGLHHGDSASVGDADVVFVAMPPDAIVPWIRSRAGDFRRGAFVIDVCGVKTPVMEEMAKVPQDGWTFVGGHPMAGREVSGYENSSAGLFAGASMLLTPPPGLAAGDRARLEAFFKSLGFGMVVFTTPARHDEMIAFTSQLCHVIASAYSQDRRVEDAIGYSAGSYANMTRIATMDPEVWTSLFMHDAKSLGEVLDSFIERLGRFRAALAAGDEAALKAFISAGAEAKRRELAARERG